MISPGAEIGILGGGQLGRMLAIAAAELGFDTHIFTPESESPAARVSTRATIAAYDDEDALKSFAMTCDVITAEFENVPAATLTCLAGAGAIVRPGATAFAACQDRVAEKSLFQRLGAQTVAFAPVNCVDDLLAGLETMQGPAILKTRRFGYDGKGQFHIHSADQAEAAVAFMGARPTILEAKCAFKREVSIVAARGVDGAFACYDLVENVHEGGILHRTIAPAPSSEGVQERAAEIAARVAEELNYVGVFAIEFFELHDGTLLVNEMAPRVHNTGHWSADACVTGQFAQHIRAIAGWPLGEPARLCDAEMINLIGDEAGDWPSWAREPDVRVHLYGKREMKAGRKMGHVTRLFARR